MIYTVLGEIIFLVSAAVIDAQWLGNSAVWIVPLCLSGIAATWLIERRSKRKTIAGRKPERDDLRVPALAEKMLAYSNDVLANELTSDRAALLMGRVGDIDRRMRALGLPGMETQDRWNLPTLALKFGMMSSRVGGALEEGDLVSASAILAELNAITRQANNQNARDEGRAPHPSESPAPRAGDV